MLTFKKPRLQRQLPAKYQNGAALITVMFVMLILLVIATISFRQSRSNLSLLSSSQVQKLLFQSSDMALAKIEQFDRNTKGSAAITGLKGYIQNVLAEGTEIAFCLRPRTKTLFTPAKVTNNERLPNGTIRQLRTGGACKVGTNDDYVNAKKVILTQINIKKGTNRSVDFPLDNTTGGNINIKTVDATVYVTSIAPTYRRAGVKDKQINDCLAKDIADDYENTNGIQSINDCLEALGVPNHTQVQDIRMQAI